MELPQSYLSYNPHYFCVSCETHQNKDNYCDIADISSTMYILLKDLRILTSNMANESYIEGKNDLIVYHRDDSQDQLYVMTYKRGEYLRFDIYYKISMKQRVAILVCNCAAPESHKNDSRSYLVKSFRQISADIAAFSGTFIGNIYEFWNLTSHSCADKNPLNKTIAEEMMEENLAEEKEQDSPNPDILARKSERKCQEINYETIFRYEKTKEPAEKIPLDSLFGFVGVDDYDEDPQSEGKSVIYREDDWENFDYRTFLN